MGKEMTMSHGQTVILTGASGFVGRHIVPILLKNNCQIIVIGRQKTSCDIFDWFDQVDFVECDIETFQPEQKLLNIPQDASLIHLAWGGLPNFKSNFHFEKNLPQHYQFLRHMIKIGIRHLLVAGTCLEYGMINGPLSANARPAPQTPYAFAKDALRQQLEYLKAENPFTLQWARLFYMYGEGQNQTSIIPLLDQAIAQGDTHFNMSGGEQLRDYLHVEQVAQQIFEVFTSEKTGNFNICSGKPISIRRLVEERIKHKQSDIKLNLGHYPYPDYEPMAFWGTP